MREKLKIICMSMLVFLTTISLNGCIDRNEELDQYSAEDSWTFDFPIMQDHDPAQSFIPSLRKLTRIELKLEKQGDPGYINVSIKKNLYDVDLVSVQKESNSLPSSTNWISFDLEDITLIPGNTYFIVCKSNSGVIENYIKWRGSDNDFYTNGHGWKYDPMTGLWDDRPDTDFCFKTYGSKGINLIEYQHSPIFKFLSYYPRTYELIEQMILSIDQ